MKKKYPISSEFFPLNVFTPVIDRRAIALMNRLYHMPKSLYDDPSMNIRSVMIPGYGGGEIELKLFEPAGMERPAPCFLYIHGGGFVFGGASSHYRHAVAYSKGAGCVTAFVEYRLAPEHTFPCQQEDCYAAFMWLHDHAEELGIDPDRIGVGGGSAGGMLSVTTCLMARDRGSGAKPLFQLLAYPFLDARNSSDSARRYTDTPMWNSTLSVQVGPLINPDGDAVPLELRSPAEAERLEGMPPAYSEVAEFDPLRDDGILYCRRLKETGIETEFHDTMGTMHGYDFVLRAPTTVRMRDLRIDFMKRKFNR